MIYFVSKAISIHALVKRATYEMQRNVTAEGNFNPRPREEGDDIAVPERKLTVDISIHALVKRATIRLVRCRFSAEFQSTPS